MLSVCSQPQSGLILLNTENQVSINDEKATKLTCHGCNSHGLETQPLSGLLYLGNAGMHAVHEEHVKQKLYLIHVNANYK